MNRTKTILGTLWKASLPLLLAGCVAWPGIDNRKPRPVKSDQLVAFEPPGRQIEAGIGAGQARLALPRPSLALAWDYPSLTNGLAFEAWHSTDLFTWAVLARTNQGPLPLIGGLPAEFFKVRAFTYRAGFTNYSDWARK